MSEQRVLVAEDGDGRISIYRRGKVFHYDLRLRGYDKDRGSTKCSTRAAAETFAKKRYEAAKRQACSGLSPAKSKLTPRQVVERFLEYLPSSKISHSEQKKAEFILPLLVDWIEEGGYSSLDAIPPLAFENDNDVGPARDFVVWRRLRNAHLSETYTYMRRDGTEVEAPRPARHRREPSADSLHRELNPVRTFLKWSRKNGFLTTGLTVGALKKKVRIQTPDCARGEEPDESSVEDDELDNWISVYEYADLLEATQAICLEVVRDQVKARSKYRSQYRNRDQSPYGRKVKSWWSFFIWLVIIVNSGMRPIEWRNLRWGKIRYHTTASGEQTLRLFVAGKGKKRKVAVRKGVQAAFNHIAQVTCESSLDDMLARAKTDEGVGNTRVFPLLDYNDHLQEAAARAGIEKHLTHYSLRHTYMNWQLLYTKLTPFDVSILAGTSEAVLKKHYAHISSYELVEDIEKQRGILELTDAQVGAFLANLQKERE